jgi:hypothetical protein
VETEWWIAALAAGVLAASADGVLARIRALEAVVFFLAAAGDTFSGGCLLPCRSTASCEAVAMALERNTAEVVRARGKEELRGRGAGPSLAGVDTQLCI